MPSIIQRAKPLATILVVLILIYAKYGFVKSYFWYRKQYKEEQRKTAKYNKLYLEEIKQNETLRAKVYDPVQMEGMRIRAKNADRLYKGLHDCTFDLNACISVVSKMEDPRGQHGIFLERLRRHRERYETLLKATSD